MRYLVAALILISAATAYDDSWMNEPHYTLTDGNELYSFCKAAESTAHTTEDGKIEFVGSTDAMMNGHSCYAYIRGVVDSIPLKDFHPTEKVRLSQFVDVVTQYLRDHPAERNQPAYGLVRIALTKAFHK
jgi:hypothetical protein